MLTSDNNGFERIADEDDEPAAPAKGRGRSKAKSDAPEELAPAKKKAPAKRAAAKANSLSQRRKRPPKKKTASKTPKLAIKNLTEIAEMAVRRGGRGRRRGGKKEEGGEEAVESQESTDAPGRIGKWKTDRDRSKRLSSRQGESNVRPSRKANQPKSVSRRRMTAHAAVITEKIVNHVRAENVVDADEMTDRAETGRPVIALAVTGLLMKAGATAMIAATAEAARRSRRSLIC